LQEVDVLPLDPTDFERLLDPRQAETFRRDLDLAADALKSHTFWHVNSTATGGGVAEMLQSVLCYLEGGGVPTRWAVIDGDDEFFVLTKRIHHFLHGSEGDGGSLGDAEHSAYLATLDRQWPELTQLVQPGDVVVLHDPQTVGFAPRLRDLGVGVIWSCHVGTDDPNAFCRQAWDFLAPYVAAADKVVFSRSTYVWDVLDTSAVEIIPPCIDAFSPKNQFLEPATVAAILSASGLVPDNSGGPSVSATFLRQDRTEAVIGSKATVFEESPIDPKDRIVTQISRWDPLKDHEGVMKGFCRHVSEDLQAQLVLAGPSPESIADDPEGEQTLDDLRHSWEQLPEALRERVHIACLPMNDLEENAAIVNALQRRSDVIVQKSLAEGFGLTVAEAMWKEVPTVASAVGGIQDQIEDHVSGLLIQDADDLDSFGAAISRLLQDPDEAQALGSEAHVSVRDNYLAPCYLARFLELALAVH
jgi:trehalose synthase